MKTAERQHLQLKWAMGLEARWSQEPTMCTRITCGKCGKPGWVGCGKHVEQILRDVKPADRCQCPRPKGWLARLFDR